MTIKAFALTSVAIGALWSSHPTLAQTTSAAAPAALPDEIIVTAQKRSERLSQVPIAISAFTSKTRDLIGIDTLQDYTNFTPGLSYSASNDRVYLRGVGRETNTIGSDPGVATYSDGVYNASTVAVSEDSLFLERTEILRGPQGTLYGRNSIGGAIDVISKRPTDTLQGEARATVANYGVYDLESAVSGPLAKGLEFRLAGQRNEQDDGYFKNLAGGPSEGGKAKSYYLEGQLQAELAPNLDGWIKVFGADTRSNPRTTNVVGPYDYGAFPVGSLTPGAGFGYTTAGFNALGSNAANPGHADYRHFSANTPSTAHLRDNYGATIHLDWRLPGVNVKYVGGVQHYKYDATTDLDNTSVVSYTYPLNPAFSVCAYYIPGCTPLTVFPSQKFVFGEDKTFWSNELDFSSSHAGPIQWIAGLYEYGERFKQSDQFTDPSQPQLLAPANGPANPSGDFVNAGGNLNTTSYAVFGQADWSITPTIKLTGGLRYTWDHKEGTEHLRELCFGLPACGYAPDQYGSYTPALDITASQLPGATAPGAGLATINATTGIASRRLSDGWSATTGTAGLEWTPNTSTLGYAKYSRGYKAGGFNEGGISAQPETNPEYIDAFEVGVKHQFGRQFQLNAATYYYSYKGFQVPLSVNTPGGAQLTEFFNLQKVVSYGAEVEAIWRPTNRLDFLLSYSYLDATIKNGCCFVDGTDPLALQPGAHPSGAPAGGQQAQSVVGQTVPESPKNKIALNGNYRFDFRPGSLTVSGSYIWKDETYDSIFNRSYNRAPSYTQVDLRALWTDASDHYTLIFYAKNLFDTRGYDGASGAQLTSPPAASQTSVAQSYSFTSAAHLWCSASIPLPIVARAGGRVHGRST